MSLDNIHVVDAVGIDKASGCAILTIVDSWDWSDEQAHLVALQGKFNSYLAFIEGGQIWESYPDAVGRDLIIDVIGRFPLPGAGRALLEKAAEAASALGAIVRAKTV